MKKAPPLPRFWPVGRGLLERRRRLLPCVAARRSGRPRVRAAPRAALEPHAFLLHRFQLLPEITEARTEEEEEKNKNNFEISNPKQSLKSQ